MHDDLGLRVYRWRKTNMPVTRTAAVSPSSFRLPRLPGTARGVPLISTDRSKIRRRSDVRRCADPRATAANHAGDGALTIPPGQVGFPTCPARLAGLTCPRLETQPSGETPRAAAGAADRRRGTWLVVVVVVVVDLELVAVGPLGVPEVGQIACELSVIAGLGVARVEVLGVVVPRRLRARDERRVDHVGQRPAGILELESAA